MRRTSGRRRTPPSGTGVGRLRPRAPCRWGGGRTAELMPEARTPQTARVLRGAAAEWGKGSFVPSRQPAGHGARGEPAGAPAALRPS